MDIIEATKIINYTSNSVLSRVIASGFGMTLVFNEKVVEATDFIAAGYPIDLTTWPFIQAESEALGITPTKAADDIIIEKSNWVAIAVLVEKVRVKAIFDVNQLNADVSGIVATCIVALNAI